MQLFEHPENSEWVSIISVIIFAVNIVAEQKLTYLVTIFLFFFKFPLPSTLTAPPALPLLQRPEYVCCVNKLRQNIDLQTWIWRHIVTSQTTYIQ